MERLRYRSTSIIDLQGELRERDLLAAAEHGHRTPMRRPHRTLFGLTLRWRRVHRADPS
jgi:hypothetical protein